MHMAGRGGGGEEGKGGGRGGGGGGGGEGRITSLIPLPKKTLIQTVIVEKDLPYFSHLYDCLSPFSSQAYFHDADEETE